MSNALLYLGGVLFFVVALMLSIGLHELGHLTLAKKFGARVNQYFIGFGPTLWSKTKGETEYGIKAIPLGGFIRILGMLAPGPGEQAKLDELSPEDSALKIRHTDTGLFTSLIASARKGEYEEIKAEDKDRLFYKLTWWRKFIVMAAGPTVNLVIAFVIFSSVFAFYGERNYEATSGTPEVGYIAQCAVPPYGEDAKTCTPAQESPAKKSGLKKGDLITELNSVPTKDWDSFTRDIALLGKQPAELTVVRGDKTLTLTAPITEIKRPTQANSKVNEVTGYLGVVPVLDEEITYQNPLYTAKWMGAQTVRVFDALKYIPPKLQNVTLAIVGVEERDPNGPISIIGGARFSGELASYDSPVLTETTTSKLVDMLTLVAIFNLFLAIINFLPLLPLDGGHMIGALWEGVKRFFSRLVGRPEPKPVDIARMLPLAYVFGLTLFFMGALLIIGDIVVPISLH